MVFAVDYKIKSDNSGLKSIKQALKNKKIRVGILDNPKEAEIGFLQHFGGEGVYYYGPHEGETVDVPARPFIKAPVENYGKEIIERVFETTELSKEGLDLAYNRVGNWLKSKIQEYIENVELAKSLNPTANGDGGNSWRTIETKGFDHPLMDKGNLLSSIKYEVSK